MSKSTAEPGRWKIFRFIFGFTRPSWGYFFIALFLYGSQTAIMSLINSYMIGGLTQAVLDKSMSNVFVTSGISGVMYLLFLAGAALGVYLFCMGMAKGDKRLKTAVFRAFLSKNIEDAGHSGEGIASLNTDADSAGGIYGDMFSHFLMMALPTLILAVSIFVVDYRVGLVIFVVGLLCVFVQGRFAKPLGKIAKENLEANAESVKRVSDIFSGGLIIRAYSLQDGALDAFDGENRKLLRLSVKEAFVNMLQRSFGTIQGLMTIFAIFAFGGWLAARGELSVASLLALVPLSETFTQQIEGIGSTWAGMQAPLEAGRRIYRLLGGKREQNEARAAEKPVKFPNYDINIQNMSFSYKDSGKNTLKGVNLSINENEFAAFVGESGSGKSTLLRAIAGSYERESLGVSIGGVGFSRDIIGSWRGMFACVDQSCKLFDMTIGENIALGKPGATAEEIRAAAAAANADGFIAALEGGYDAPAGEKGASLSGGQKQRIAIARALIRKAPILVFDEATSALDAESERQVMETILSLRGSHTILMTTHNPKNVKQADKVAVMEDGRVKKVEVRAKV